MRSRAASTRVTDGTAICEVWDGERFVTVPARTAYWHDERDRRRCTAAVASSRRLRTTCTSRPTATRGRRRSVRGRPARARGAADPTTRAPTLDRGRGVAPRVARCRGLRRARGHGRASRCHDDAVLARSRRLLGASRGRRTSRKYQARTFGVQRSTDARRSGSTAIARTCRMLAQRALHCSDGHKRVPKRVLNAAPHLQEAFLDGLQPRRRPQGRPRDRPVQVVPHDVADARCRPRLAGPHYAGSPRQHLPASPVRSAAATSYLINLGSGLTSREQGRPPSQAAGRGAPVERRPTRVDVRPRDRDRPVRRRRRLRRHPQLARVVGWSSCRARSAHGVAADQAGPDRRAVARQPRRGARLGLRRRLRRGDVADAAAGRARRLRRRQPDRRTRSGGSARSPSSTSASSGRTTCAIDERFMRPAEVDLLIGDADEGEGRARLAAADDASRSS